MCGLRFLPLLRNAFPPTKCLLLSPYYIYWRPLCFSCLYPPFPMQDSDRPTPSLQNLNTDSRVLPFDQMYPTASGSLLWYLLAAIVLLMLLCVVGFWQGWKQSRGIRLRPSGTDTPRAETSAVRSSGNVNRAEKPLLKGERWFRTSPLPPSMVHLSEAYWGGVWQSTVTSGQLAARVQEPGGMKDVEQNNMYHATHSWIPPPIDSLHSPWPNDKLEDATRIEHDLLEFYHLSDVQEMWRRRLLAFVGQ